MRDDISAVVMGKKPWPIFLTGEVGSGKTCAVLCMIDIYGGIYRTVQELAEEIARAKRGELVERLGNVCSSKVTAETVRGWWTRTRFAVLDELGLRDKPTDHEAEVVKNVLDDREGLPLVVVSNLDLGDIMDVYDARIADRINAGTPVVVAGESRR